MAGQDMGKRLKMTWAAWIKPKAEENEFIYAMLGASCHIVLCFRAKEKLKIVRGKDPVDLGWQPIAGDRITFETIFTLTLPPHCKGVPDLSASEMREPFDTMIPAGKQLSEETGRLLAEWAAGQKPEPAPQPASTVDFSAADPLVELLLAYADERDMREPVEAAIAANRAGQDLAGHTAWLEAQIDKAQKTAAAA
jgi:hypothetical protein